MKRVQTLGMAVGLLILTVLILSGCGPKIYNDGVYKGISQADNQGYAVAELTVENDRITAVRLTEYIGTGELKDYSTYPYGRAKEANAEIASRLVGQKDAVGIDTVSGATGSSAKYVEAVGFALEKARITPLVSSIYFDGTFYGKAPEGDKGYGVAWVTIRGDRITSVELEDVTEESVFKNLATYPYPVTAEAKSEMEKRFVEKNGPVVDAYASATSSSTAWIQAVQDALANAKVR